MRTDRHRGFTILEAIASVFVLTLVVTAGMAILLNASRQAKATQAKLAAHQIGELIRDDVETNALYADVSLWQAGLEVVLTSETCAVSPYGCALFGYASGTTVFDDNVMIRFFAPTAESLEYRVIHFQIEIEYYPSRILEMKGILYEN